MMAIFFIGLGISVIACGFASEPFFLVVALAGVGLFAAIYHPIGIPWLIANTNKSTGKALAINGVFGGLGPATAALLTGFLVDYIGWRWAFWIPGVIITATGFAMLWYIKTGLIPATGLRKKDAPTQQKKDALRVFLILLFTMFMSGLIYHSTQSVLPKFFTERLQDFVDGSVSRAGILVSVIYAVSAMMQLIGGYFADRYSLKSVYVIGWFCQIAFLAAVASMAGYSVFIAVLLISSISTGILPAENMLLYKYSPEKHKGLSFGVKFVLSFGAAPLSLHLISFIQERTGDFYWLFMGLSSVAVIVFLVTLMLPSEKALPQSAAAE